MAYRNPHYFRDYFRAQGEKHRAYNREWTRQHKESHRQSEKRYRESHRDHLNAKSRLRRKLRRLDPETRVLDNARHVACLERIAQKRGLTVKELRHGYNLVSKLRRHGVTLDWYTMTLRDHGGVCAICKQSDSRGRLVVDHDHHTNLPRGLLCRTCNSALGFFRDHPDRVKAALQYLSS